MPNHFHIVIKIRDSETLIHRWKELIEIKNEKIKEAKDNSKLLIGFDESKFDAHEFVMQQFSNLFSGYAQAFNKQQKRKGALFLDYLKRKQIRHESYLKNLIAYVHYNAVHHGFCKNADDWKFSSYQIPFSNKMTKLERETLLQFFETREGYKKYHQDFKDMIDDDLEFL